LFFPGEAGINEQVNCVFWEFAVAHTDSVQGETITLWGMIHFSKSVYHGILIHARNNLLA
jgi:hypothetical protein